jgi:hypothetical protein
VPLGAGAPGRANICQSAMPRRIVTDAVRRARTASRPAPASTRLAGSEASAAGAIAGRGVGADFPFQTRKLMRYSALPGMILD